MEHLHNSRAYSTEIASSIESMGPMAVSIANRWMLGWSDRVKALVETDTYLDCLKSQVAHEKEILANEPNLRHLSRREVLEIYEIKESPPAVG